MSVINNTNNFNDLNYVTFVKSLNDLENEIDSLVSYHITDLNTPKNLADRLSCLNQNIPDQNSMELSTKIMSLAYILDVKVSKSYLPDLTIMKFSTELQGYVQSSYCKFPADLIQLIATYLPVKELVAFAQVDKRSYNALETLKTPLLKNYLETKVTSLNEQIIILQEKSKKQLPDTLYYLELEGASQLFKMSDFDSAERLLFRHNRLRQFLPRLADNGIQMQLQILYEKETKQRNLVLVKSHISEFYEIPVKRKIAYNSLLKQIHNLSEKDTVQPEDVEGIRAQLQNVQQYFASNPSIEAEFGYLYNHLIYAFERKLDELDLQESQDNRLEQITPKNQLPNFPHDVLYLIFENLELQDQVAVRLVCKDFKGVIDSRIANTTPFLTKKVIHLNNHESTLNWKYERAKFLLENLELCKPDYHPFSQRWKEYIEKKDALENEIQVIKKRLETIRENLWAINLPKASNVQNQ